MEIKTWRDVRQAIADIRQEVGWKTNLIAVENYGRLEYWDEVTVRAFLVLMQRAANQNKAQFEELRKNVVLYKKRTKGHKKPYRTVVFNEHGRITDGFDKGFLDANSELSLTLLTEAKIFH